MGRNKAKGYYDRKGMKACLRCVSRVENLHLRQWVACLIWWDVAKYWSKEDDRWWRRTFVDKFDHDATREFSKEELIAAMVLAGWQRHRTEKRLYDQYFGRKPEELRPKPEGLNETFLKSLAAY